MEGLTGMQHALITTGCWGKDRVEGVTELEKLLRYNEK